MTAQEERDSYWKIVEALRELIIAGNRSKEEILEEMEEDLSD